MKPIISSVKPKGRAALPLWALLQEHFPDAQCECRFPWLVVPTMDERSGREVRIYDLLIAHCQTTKATQKPKKQACDCAGIYSGTFSARTRLLEFDFFIPSVGVAIEFDERQHFTAERAVTLYGYDDGVCTNFDIAGWISRCDAVGANDADPPCRDWQRAYRDAIRDLRAADNGIRLHRIAYDETVTTESICRLILGQ